MQRQTQPIDRKLMREINQNTLLNLIRAHAPISRMQLRRLSGLSLGTIVGIVAILIEQQLVIEKGVAESTGGRKAGLLEILPEGGYTIGISLREHSMVEVLLDLHGQVVCENLFPVVLRNNEAHALALIAAGVEQFIAQSGVPREKIIGLGCGISGPVNAEAGISVDSWILNWHNVEIAAPLAARLGIAVFVDNSVNCLACYENLYGHGQQFRDFLLVSLGRGLGMASVIRTQHFRGAQGIGAEFGHIPLFNAGRHCECGNVDCLEAYVGDRGILQTYAELGGHLREGLDIDVEKQVVALANEAWHGDAIACQAFQQAGKELGRGLAVLVNLFNPQGIIIYGGEGYRLKLLLEAMQTAMAEHIFSQLGKNLELIVELDTTVTNWARGAGCLVLRDFFSSPTKM